MSTAHPPLPPAGLTAANLNVAKEDTYFAVVLILSIVFWLALALTIVGLFYAAAIALFVWLGNGLLVAHLRSEAVRVDERQLPRLHATFREVCERLGVTRPPALHVLQAGGMLNAFATRFTGRDFVVIYSDFLEALGPDSPELRFVLGHELGHIKSRHILKQIFLAPGLFFPLAGPAYRRAWESSCDRYGAFASQDVEGSVRAMMVISGGREGRQLDAGVFARQHAEERGLFVSLHELTSTYPTLSRRVSDLLALRDGAKSPSPRRHPLAYCLALLMPGGNVAGGGAVGAMMMVFVIGLLAAMAIPAFQAVRQSAIEKACTNNQRQLVAAVDQHRLENGRFPAHLGELAGPNKYLLELPACPKGGTYALPAEADEPEELRCSVHGTIFEMSLARQVRRGRPD